MYVSVQDNNFAAATSTEERTICRGWGCDILDDSGVYVIGLAVKFCSRVQTYSSISFVSWMYVSFGVSNRCSPQPVSVLHKCRPSDRCETEFRLGST